MSLAVLRSHHSTAWVDLDSTPLITGAGSYSVALTTNTADGIIFASTHSAHIPSVRVIISQ